MQSIPARMQARMALSPTACGRDAHARPVGLVGDRGELLVGVLLGAGGGAVRHHATRRGHLDQLGAVADLVAHARPHIVDTVGDALGDATSGMMPGASR